MENINNQANRAKFLGIALISPFIAACGGRAETLDLDTAQEPLIADNNFGVIAGSFRQCNPGASGQCWYPSGFGTDYRWDVCPIAAGMTQAQSVRATNAQLHVMQTLRNGGVDIGFGCPAAGHVPEIQVFKGGAPALACAAHGACAADKLLRYVTAFCTSSQVLAESPSIAGSSHSYCYKYNVEIDYNAIDAAFPNAADAAHVYEQATGFAFAAASLGTGLHSLASMNHYWTFDGVFPLLKHDVHPADYCRADANYEGVDFFAIRKQDNSCD